MADEMTDAMETLLRLPQLKVEAVDLPDGRIQMPVAKWTNIFAESVNTAITRF